MYSAGLVTRETFRRLSSDNSWEVTNGHPHRSIVGKVVNFAGNTETCMRGGRDRGVVKTCPLPVADVNVDITSSRKSHAADLYVRRRTGSGDPVRNILTLVRDRVDVRRDTGAVTHIGHSAVLGEGGRCG